MSSKSIADAGNARAGNRDVSVTGGGRPVLILSNARVDYCTGNWHGCLERGRLRPVF